MRAKREKNKKREIKLIKLNLEQTKEHGFRNTHKHTNKRIQTMFDKQKR